MAHESFEDPGTAALMNELFVNIKVDREERPDIDAIYMEAVQAMTQHGGWPMTVFLTPQGKPFYGGTYFPPTPRYGMPSFPQLLTAIADAWRNRRRELESAGERMVDVLNRSSALGPAEAELTPDVLNRAWHGMLHGHDRTEGGFGGAPKFPQPMNLDFLLQSYLRTGDQTTLRAVTLTLHKMAAGGIYDQLGGGFHRYSTDDHWLAPHFEKMLYDNAQLARTYLHAWQVTGDATFRRIVEETLDYVLREMTSPEGGFYSTQDADSEGREGKFFLWTPAEVAALLGPEDASLFCAYFDVTAQGNFHEGGSSANILHIPRELTVVARELNVTPERLAQAVARGRAILFAAREQRVHPGRDDKILAEWNGLMLHAFAEAGAALDRPDYVAAAERAAAFVLERMGEWANHESANKQISNSDGRPSSVVRRLYRTYKDGRAHLNAYLEDYAAVALGFIGLYQATFELRWLEAAISLTEVIVARFADGDAGGFFQTATDHEQLIARRKDFVDSAVPSGNSLAAESLVAPGQAARPPRRRRPRRGDHTVDGGCNGPTAAGVRSHARRAGLRPQPRAGDRDHRRPGRDRHAGPAGRSVAALSAEQRAGLRRSDRRGGARRCAAPGQSRPDRRRSDRLRLPELRLQAAGQRAFGLRPAARHVATCVTSSISTACCSRRSWRGCRSASVPWTNRDQTGTGRRRAGTADHRRPAGSS